MRTAPPLRALGLGLGLALALFTLTPSAHAQVWVAPPPPPHVVVSSAPHIYIRDRILWHLAHLGRVVPAPAPRAVYAPSQVVYAQASPVYVTPTTPTLPPVPPPVIVPPPPSYYYSSAPAPARQEEELVVMRAVGRPGWEARLGLGFRGTGQLVNDGWDNVGLGGELLYRTSPHVSTELAVEYQRNTGGAIDRRDIPVTFGVRLHIGRPSWWVSPYFVFAGGVDYAAQGLHITDDTAFFLDGQMGGGLEIRLGQHVALTADARLDAKKRLNDPSPQVLATRVVNGQPVHALGDEVGGQFRLGVAVYF